MHINATYAASKAQLFQPDYLPGKTPAVESYLPQIIREWATKDVALSVQYDPERTVRPGSEPKRIPRCAQARNLSDQILADLAQVCVVCVNEFKPFSRCAGLKIKKFYKKKAYTLIKIFPLRGLKN